MSRATNAGDTPLVRVVRGTPTDEELAALVVVLTGLATSSPAPAAIDAPLSRHPRTLPHRTGARTRHARVRVDLDWSGERADLPYGRVSRGDTGGAAARVGARCRRAAV